MIKRFAKVISALCSIRRSFSKERASPSHQLNCAAMQDPNWRLCKEVLATNVRQVLSTGQITFLHAHPGLQPPSTWQNKQQCSWDGALSVHVVGSWVAGSDSVQGTTFCTGNLRGGWGGRKIKFEILIFILTNQNSVFLVKSLNMI